MNALRILTSEDYFENHRDQFTALDEKAMREEKYYLMYNHVVLDNSVSPHDPSKLEKEEWAYFDGDKMVGFFQCQHDARIKTNARLAMFYVLPEYRGQKLGSKAFEICLNWATEKQFLTAQGHIHPANTASVSLAKQHGFYLFAESAAKMIWGDQTKEHCQIYRKDLQAI